jgi:ubiquinone/menaquinone biosynthesis C-methylase UbiE
MSVDAAGREQWLHRIASRPIAYDFIQWAAGRPAVYRHVRALMRFPAGALVLDVGGGTGNLKPQLRNGERHVCVDIERPKLDGYVSKFLDARALQGDATCLPVRDGIADVVALSSVTHHLTDSQLDAVFSEAARVLRPGGVLFVCDAVWSPSHRAGRLLWRYDRGSHPRTTEEIDAALTRSFRVVQKSEFSVVHAFAAFLCRPVNAP